VLTLNIKRGLVKLVMTALIIALVRLSMEYYARWHNVDLAVNFMKAYECDWVSTKECVSYKDLYIDSMSELLLFPVYIILLSLALGWILNEI